MPHSPALAANQFEPTKTAPVIVATLDSGPVPDIVLGLVAQQRVLAVDTLDEALAVASGAPVLAVTAAPETQLLALLNADDAVVSGLSRWVAQAEALLAVARPARRQVTLLDRAVLTSDPQGSAGIVAARLGLQARIVPVADVPVDVPAPDPQVVLAALLLHSDPRARVLADEIRAMMWHPNPAQPIGTDDIGRALDALRSGQRQDAAAWATCALLQQDLLQMQDQLERQSISGDLRKGALMAAEQRMQVQAATAAQRESILGAVLLERGRQIHAQWTQMAGLEAQLRDQSQEIIALRGLAEQNDQARHAAARARDAALERAETQAGELADLQGQTHDLIRALVSAEEAAKAARQEATTSAGALADLRRQHEAASAEAGAAAKALTAEIADLRQRMEEITVARAAAEQAVQETRQDAAAQRAAFEQVLAELEAVYASNSWKITGPIRAARRLLGQLGRS